MALEGVLLSLLGEQRMLEGKIERDFARGRGISAADFDQLEKINAEIVRIQKLAQKPIFIGNKLQQDESEALTKNGKTSKAKSSILKVKTKGGILAMDEKRGSISLKKVNATVHPNRQEMRALSLLMKQEGHQFTYAEFFKKEIGTDIKDPERRKLSFIIRNLKKILGMLPAKKAKNKNIIKNLKNVGYQLIL